MDTTDRNDAHLPARLPASSSHLPAMAGARPVYDLATVNPTVQINPQGVLRGLARNWWKILLIWLTVSVPLVYILYVQIEPTYEAYSTISTQPPPGGLYDQGSKSGGPDTLQRYIETQREFILSDRVLKLALADPEVAKLPFVRDSITPVQDLKKALRVTNTGHTYNIVVQFESTSPNEAATIVNSVVRSYLGAYSEYQQGTNANLIKQLQAYLEKLDVEKRQMDAQLLAQVDKGLSETAKISPVVAIDRGSNSDDDKKSDAATADVTLDQYRDYKARIFDKKLELKKLEFELQRRLANSEEQVVDPDAAMGRGEDQLEDRIMEVFKSDPAVASLIQDYLATEDELAHNVSVARHSSDPARQNLRKRRDQLKANFDSLWREQYFKIRQAVTAQMAADAARAGADATAPNELTVAQLEMLVERAKQDLTALNELLQSMEVEKKASQSETYRAEQLRADIESLNKQREVIFMNLESLKFSTSKDVVRVDLMHAADVPRAPAHNKRIKYMLVAPCAILGLVLALFALLEVKAERVADPDALSTRVQSEVFSLPPLPTARAVNRLSGPGDDDQIDRFIQRLDHLRFAVCGDNPEVGLGRCVLITSAIGGEGKTTLAAQLAARCGHAAHTTLLIDADLRRGSLCPLLDVPEGLGLSDVLMDEANVEDVVIPVQGGTFHLLSAGTPVADASRLFQGRNFGMLIARLRQMYDLIIIDSPPVLPVPDGLILGRWTDGAVLASRYDVSRAPQVERARRQLNNAGIPVLGTVINGMRSADSYYGRYSYSRSRSGPGDSNDESSPA